MYDINGSRPNKAKELGNLTPGDGIRYAGRGYIQITGRSNYRAYGKRLGIDLENAPDRALEIPIAATILALYFKDHGIAAAAEAGDWVRVRKLVNGGKNGLGQFLTAEQSLSTEEQSVQQTAQQEAPVPPSAPDALHLSIVDSLLKLVTG